MRVRLLSFDSMGVRSMCTVVETGDAKIMIDPGAALGPRRYGLKPHPIELERLRICKALIAEEAADSDLIIITHYHYDHFPRPSDNIEWLRDKRILLKDPSNMINWSQRRRAAYFLERLRKVEARPEVADGGGVRIGRSRIRFSKPVEHGNDSRLGYVLQVLIADRGEKLLHSSDVEGFVSGDQVRFVRESKPDILICDGPMTYMLGNKFGEEDLENSLRNLASLVKAGFLSDLIIDHHLLRDLEWKARIQPLLDLAEGYGVKVSTAARFMGLEELLLEANRRKLYEEYPEI